MITEIKVETQRLTAAIVRYQQVSGKTIEETLIKHGREFSNNAGRALRAIGPAKGSIRAEQSARFNSGGGIRVSPG